MTELALSTEVTIAWWISLAVGLVVAGVVWALLERLRQAVKRVDTGVTAVWKMGGQVAQNTQVTHLLGTTKTRGIALRDEAERHAGRRTS